MDRCIDVSNADGCRALVCDLGNGSWMACYSRCAIMYDTVMCTPWTCLHVEGSRLAVYHHSVLETIVGSVFEDRYPSNAVVLMIDLETGENDPALSPYIVRYMMWKIVRDLELCGVSIPGWLEIYLRSAGMI